ncbi:MAG: HAD family hydrolase [Mycobacterium leprae]
MRFRGYAFVDWDDTMAENIRYFHEAEEANSQLIARATGHDPVVVRQRGQEIDLATARRIGLVKESLSIAWVECYHEFCAGAGLEPDPAVEEAVRQNSCRPYEIKQELLPGSRETLAWLHEAGFEVTIWTAGDRAVQERKVAESGLTGFVHRVVAVADKDPERLASALGDRDRSMAFVVGNSVHSDIRPALALGIQAYHVPAETWAFDHARLDLTDAHYQRVEVITELPAVLTARFGLGGEAEAVDAAG